MATELQSKELLAGLTHVSGLTDGGESDIRILRTGDPGSGKSWANEHDALQWVLGRPAQMLVKSWARRSLLFIDPHGVTAERLARRFWMLGYRDRLLLDRLADTEHCPVYKLRRDFSDDPAARRQDVYDERKERIDAAIDERGHFDKANNHPFTRQALDLGYGLALSEGAPDDALDYSLRFRDERFPALVGACDDPLIRRMAEEACRLPPMEVERQYGPGRRIIDAERGNIPLRNRDGNGLNLGKAHKGGLIHLISGLGVSAEAGRPIYLRTLLRSMHAAMLNHTELLIIADESARYAMTGLVAGFCEQIRKWEGLGLILCCQTPKWPPEIEMSFWQAIRRQELFRCSPEVLKDRLPMFWSMTDLYQEHHRDLIMQQFHDGFDEVDETRMTEGETTQPGRIGPSKSLSRSSYRARIPRYRTESREARHFVSTSDQVMQLANRVSKQGPRERFVFQNGRSWFETVPFVSDPFPKILERTYERRFEAFLQEMWSRDYFRKGQAPAVFARIGAADRLRRIRVEREWIFEAAPAPSSELAKEFIVRGSPVTIAMVQKLRGGSYQTNHRWCERQIDQGIIAILGDVPGGGAKPRIVYGKKCKLDNLRHEVGISEVIINFELAGWAWCRGKDVDPAYRADADLRRYEHAFRLEVDLDNERNRALERRLSEYRDSKDFVLFVAPNERRIREVLRVGAFLREQLLCTTLAKAIREPFAEIWEDVCGDIISL